MHVLGLSDYLQQSVKNGIITCINNAFTNHHNPLMLVIGSECMLEALEARPTVTQGLHQTFYSCRIVSSSPLPRVADLAFC